MTASRWCQHGTRLRPDGSGCDTCRHAEVGQLTLDGDSAAEGRARRDRGLATTTASPAGQWDASVVLQAIRHLASSGEPFTADDLAPLLHRVGSQVIGAAFRIAARRNLIEPVGYAQSSSPSRHGGLLRVWRGSNAARRAS